MLFYIAIKYNFKIYFFVSAHLFICIKIRPVTRIFQAFHKCTTKQKFIDVNYLSKRKKSAAAYHLTRRFVASVIKLAAEGGLFKKFE